MKVCLVIAGVLSLAFLILIAAHEKASTKNQFPMWKEVTTQNEYSQVDSNVTLTFNGIDCGVESGETLIDIIHVTAQNPEEDITFGLDYRLDFFDDGKWYTIYTPDISIEPARVLGTGANPLEYDVPSGLFQQVGLYRLYITSLGYCEFDLLIPVKP